MGSKPGFIGDPAREEGEPAGDQHGHRALRLHRLHQCLRAGIQRNARIIGVLQRFEVEPLQHGHAGCQRALEIQLAPHGTFCDRGHFRFQTSEIRQFIEAFLSDNRGIHVGDQQPFATISCGHQGHVHFFRFQRNERCVLEIGIHRCKRNLHSADISDLPQPCYLRQGLGNAEISEDHAEARGNIVFRGIGGGDQDHGINCFLNHSRLFTGFLVADKPLRLYG